MWGTHFLRAGASSVGVAGLVKSFFGVGPLRVDLRMLGRASSLDGDSFAFRLLFLLEGGTTCHGISFGGRSTDAGVLATIWAFRAVSELMAWSMATSDGAYFRRWRWRLIGLAWFVVACWIFGSRGGLSGIALEAGDVP